MVRSGRRRTSDRVRRLDGIVEAPALGRRARESAGSGIEGDPAGQVPGCERPCIGRRPARCDEGRGVADSGLGIGGGGPGHAQWLSDVDDEGGSHRGSAIHVHDAERHSLVEPFGGRDARESARSSVEGQAGRHGAGGEGPDEGCPAALELCGRRVGFAQVGDAVRSGDHRRHSHDLDRSRDVGIASRCVPRPDGEAVDAGRGRRP